MITPGLNKEKYIWIRNTSLSPFFFFLFTKKLLVNLCFHEKSIGSLENHVLAAAGRLTLSSGGWGTTSRGAKAAVPCALFTREAAPVVTGHGGSVTFALWRLESRHHCRLRPGRALTWEGLPHHLSCHQSRQRALGPSHIDGSDAGHCSAPDLEASGHCGKRALTGYKERVCPVDLGTSPAAACPSLPTAETPR